MRIVLVTHFFPAHGGGVEKVASQLASRMAVWGHELIWCAGDNDPPPELNGVRGEAMRSFNTIERVSGFPFPLWSTASLARLAMHIRNADAVHVHDAIYFGSLAAATLARRYRKRLVVTQHIGQVPLPMLLRPALGAANRLGARAVLKRAEAVAFISPAVRRYFEALIGRRPGFHDVPNGVDHQVFHAAETDPAELRVALGMDPRRPLLLFVGRFVPKKRLPLVRELAAARPDWQWCVIGHGPEQPQAWGLTNVHVLPSMPQAELATWYRAADLLVLPSEGEGFPLVVQEAMACGLPACISADVAAGSTMPRRLWLELPSLRHQVAPLGAERISRWLAQSTEQRQAQRQACAAYATAAWNWEVAARAHLGWLQGSRD